MIRRTLKDTEIVRLSSTDISNMAVGDVLPVYICSPIQNGDYLLGYNGTTLSNKEFGTNIESQEAEYVYVANKNNILSDCTFYIRKFDDGLTLSRLITTQIKEMPSTVIHRTIMKSNGGRFLGANGTTVVTTTSQSEAETNPQYWWDFQGESSNAGTIHLYNPNSKVYLNTHNSSSSLGTSLTSNCYSYTQISSNMFMFCTQQGGQGYSPYLNGSTLSTYRTKGSFSTQYAWTVYSLDISPTTQGAVTWMYPMPYSINTFTPTAVTNLLAGFKGNVFSFNQEGSYLRHGNNATAGLSASSTGNDINAAWILYKAT